MTNQNRVPGRAKTKTCFIPFPTLILLYFDTHALSCYCAQISKSTIKEIVRSRTLKPVRDESFGIVNQAYHETIPAFHHSFGLCVFNHWKQRTGEKVLGAGAKTVFLGFNTIF